LETQRHQSLICLALALASLGVVSSGWTRPSGPAALCAVVPEANDCQSGLPSCGVCHTTPPARNTYGRQLEARLPDPTSAEAFPAEIGPVILAVMPLDADGDGFDNETELRAGTGPGSDTSFPMDAGCSGESINPRWNVCGYDHAYVFKKVTLDFCGFSPRYAEMEAFRALEVEGRERRIEEVFERCVETPYWRGRDGVIWRMAHPKIRPLAAIKSGDQAGAVPLGDYDDDYALFVHSHTGDGDVREVLTADYYVTLAGNPPTYTVQQNRPHQSLARPYRVGMISSRWFLVINTMFTAVPRTTAAQAYRSYLGLDIAKSEGLIPPQGQELIDYDEKGITAPACAVCHTTLDPLTYPFTPYEGIAAPESGAYVAQRMARRSPAIDGANIRDVPEAGYLLGQPVANLVEWAELAANSDEFAQATVRDYWYLLMGGAPTPGQAADFEALWRGLKAAHGYRVEMMLKAFIKTEAYGVP
jgi:hypothetical protein